jgi:hypothetical protein
MTTRPPMRVQASGAALQTTAPGGVADQTEQEDPLAAVAVGDASGQQQGGQRQEEARGGPAKA